MEKFIEHLQEAEKRIQIVDHMVYVTFPVVKDKRLFMKILSEIKSALANCINSVLQYEYIYKRINLYNNARENFKTFIENCAPRYNITKEELNSIVELFDILEKHRQSPMEIIKEDRIIILSENMQPKIINFTNVKNFLLISKNVLKKIKEVFTKRI